MKRTLSLLLLFPFALDASPYPEGLIIRASLMLEGDVKHIAQVRIADDGTNWQTTEDNVRYSSDLYAIALAVKKVTEETGFGNKRYPCLHVETVVTPKNDPTQKDVRTTPFTFGFFNWAQEADLTLKDDAGSPIKLILNPQTFIVKTDK